MPRDYAKEKFWGLEALAANPRLPWIHPIVNFFLEYQENKNIAPASFIDIGEYEGPDLRLSGLKLIETKVKPILAPFLPLYGAKIKVVSPNVFTQWKTNNETLSPHVADDLCTHITTMLSNSPNNAIAIRRAFHYRDAKSIPGGPTANNLHSTDLAMEKINEMYRWADGQKLGQREDASISLFLQEWLDPPNIEFAQGDVKKLPAGGDAYVEIINPDGGIIIHVRASLGDNSAVNFRHREIDEYRILYMPPTEENSAGTVRIINTKIAPQKTEMILQRSTTPPPKLHAQQLTFNKTDSNYYSVAINPSTGVAETLFNDLDLYRVAYTVGLLYHTEKKPFKVEFTKSTWTLASHQNLTSVAILEATPFDIPEQNNNLKTHHTGLLRGIIDTVEDIDLIKEKLSRNIWPENAPMIYLTPQFVNSIIENKAEIVEKLKQIGRRLIVLDSLAHTAHKTREIEGAHTVFHIEPTLLDIGLAYDIQQRGATYVADRNISQIEHNVPKPPRLITIRAANATGETKPENIGGKAAGIAKLERHGFLTPAYSLTLTRTFFEEIIAANNLTKLMSDAITSQSATQLQAVFNKISPNLKTIPHMREIDQIINAEAERVQSNPTIIPNLASFRSNAPFEDRRGAPFAGMLDSILNISVKDKSAIEQAILKVIKSHFDPNIATYIFNNFKTSDRQDILTHLHANILVQPMIKAVSSGTLFGRDTSGERAHEIVLIEANPGVSGVVDNDKARPRLTVKYDTRQREFAGITLWDGKSQNILTKQDLWDSKYHDFILSYQETKNLVLLAERMRHELHAPQDAEWALTENGTIIVLQSRPL